MDIENEELELPLQQTKVVYQTDFNGVYVGPTLADPSPLEPGVWLIPAGCVEVPPPAVDAGFIAVWRDGDWQVMRLPSEEVAAENPGLSPEELLEIERASMTLSFAQFLVGLVEQEWIAEDEANAWLSANSLPAAVEAAIATLPEEGPGGVKPRLRARARALRPTEILRTNELLLMMAAVRGAGPEQLDDFFRFYAGV